MENVNAGRLICPSLFELLKSDVAVVVAELKLPIAAFRCSPQIKNACHKGEMKTIDYGFSVVPLNMHAVRRIFGVFEFVKS